MAETLPNPQGQTARPASNWFRRNPVAAALLAVTILVLGAVLVVGWLVVRERQKSAIVAQQRILELWFASDSFLSDRVLKETNLMSDADILRGLEQAIQRHPDSARLWRASGVMFQAAGKMDSSYEALSRAIEFAQGQRDSSVGNDSLLRRSVLLREMDRIPEAAVDYRRAKRLPLPDNQEIESLPDFRSAEEVSVVLGVTNVESGLYAIHGWDSKYQPALVDGQEAWSFEPGFNYGYFFIDPTYKWSHGSNLVLRVECKTRTGRPIGVRYGTRGDAYTSITPTKIESVGSNGWKIMEFRLKNARLENAQSSGADFSLRDNQKGFFVRRVTLFADTNSAR
jgi:hypothetical protein